MGTTQRLLLALLLLPSLALAQLSNDTGTVVVGNTLHKGVTPPASGCDCGSTNAAAPCTGTSVSHTLSSAVGTSTVSFAFSCAGGACRCGKFANQYDYWVAPATDGGTVQIIGMSPATVGGADATLRNGWVANPSAITANSFMDGRLGGGTGTGTPLNPSAGSPFSINTITTPVTTVVKSHSMTETGATGCGQLTDPVSGVSRHCFWSAGVLTVLDQVPAGAGSTVLRPPMTGGEKPLLSTTLINTALLPNMGAPVRPSGGAVYPHGKTSVSFALDTALDLLGPPKVEWGASGDYTYWQYMPPMMNFSRHVSGYPPRSMEGLLESLQPLVLDPGADTAKKQLLAVRAVQWGIDYYYMWKARGYGPMYKTNGGHAVGRYAPTLLAAGLLTGAVGDAMKTDMNRMNIGLSSGYGTKDRCGFDVGNVMWNWTDTGRLIYGVFNMPAPDNACGGYSTYLQQANALYVDPGHMGDNGELDNPTSCSGPYQGINNGPMIATVNLIKAIPVLQTIDFEYLVPYLDQRLQNGSYCRADQGGGYGPMWGSCAAGVNAGLACRTNSDCPTSTCANDGDVQYTSWFSWNQLKLNAACYSNKSCPGMEGL